MEVEYRGQAAVQGQVTVLQKGSTPHARLGSLISLVGEGENRRIALAVPGYRASATEAPVGRIQLLDPTSMTVVRVIENPEACKCRFGSGIQLVAQGVVSEPRLVVTSAAEVTCPEFGHVLVFDDAGALEWSLTGRALDLRISGQLAVVPGSTAGSPRAVVAGVGRSFAAVLVAVDLDLRQVLWQVQAPGDRSSDSGSMVLAIQDVDGDGLSDLLVTNPSATHVDKIYAGVVSAMSSTTGRVLWSAWGQDADSSFGDSAIPLPGEGSEGGGLILVSAPGNLPPFTGARFYALDALTGKSRWSVGAPEGLSDPVVSMQPIHGSGRSTQVHGVALAYDVDSGLSRLFLVEVAALSQSIRWTKVDGVVPWHRSAPSGILALLDSNRANGDSGAVVDLLTGHPSASVDGMARAGIVYRCRIERQR